MKPPIIISEFIFGQIDTLEARAIPRGAASKALNWQTKIDRIELTRGYTPLGTDAGSTVVKMTSVFSVRQSNGTEILLRTRGKVLEYLKTSNDTWIEIGVNVLGSAADGVDISVQEYHSLAGDVIYINSPKGAYLKIMMANLEDTADLFDSAKNFKGYILIKQNRTFLWGRDADKSGIYGSYIDSENYTTVTAEVLGTGNGTLKTFSGTLTFKASGAKRTCFAITVTDGTETFTDNFDGTLTGDAGGTGTINYMTGAISVTFNAAVTNSTNITVNHQHVDDTDKGIADFTESGIRIAGEGFVFRQDDGGGTTQRILSYGADEYCMHEKKTWVLTLTADDTNATNLIYRKKVGIPNHRAAVATGDGIYYVDDSDKNDPQIRLLTISQFSADVIPVPISQAIKFKNKRVGIDLSGLEFDKAVGIEWSDFIIFACRTSDVGENNRLILYDKKQGTIDVLERWASDLAVYNGTLVAADPFVQNVYTLFSGFDDDESLINNVWEGGDDDFGFYGLKKVKQLVLKGLIDKEQTIEVRASIDKGSFVLLGLIEGDGSYVDAGQQVSIGRITLGRKEIGGGGEATSQNYERKLKLRLDRFGTVKLRFEAIGLGHASISQIEWKDPRLKSQKIAKKYR